MAEELTKVEELYGALVDQRTCAFPEAGQGLVASDKHGVYIITDRNGTVLHVGKTSRGTSGLKQRLKNHLYGQSSFTQKYLSGEGSKLRGKCNYTYLEVSDPRLRTLLEHYTIAHLCPRHLGVGVE